LPSPSTQDKNMIQQQFNKNRLNEKFIVTIISGSEGIYLELYNGKKTISKSLSRSNL